MTRGGVGQGGDDIIRYLVTSPNTWLDRVGVILCLIERAEEGEQRKAMLPSRARYDAVDQAHTDRGYDACPWSHHGDV